MSFFNDIELTQAIVPARRIGFFASITGCNSLSIQDAALLHVLQYQDPNQFAQPDLHPQFLRNRRFFYPRDSFKLPSPVSDPYSAEAPSSRNDLN